MIKFYSTCKSLSDLLRQHLDPFHGAKKEHIFFGIMRVFCKYCISPFVQTTYLNT